MDGININFQQDLSCININLKHKKHKRDTPDRPKPKQNAIILLNETNHHKTSYSLSDALNDNSKCQFSASKT